MSGWVRNLNTGQVEIMAEGGTKNIFQFIEKIDKSYSDSIETVEIEWAPATGEFKEFKVIQNVILNKL